MGSSNTKKAGLLTLAAAAGATAFFMTGAPSATAVVPDVFSKFDNAETVVAGGTKSFTLPLPSGAFFISAKLSPVALGDGERTIVCELSSNTNFDISTTTIPSSRFESMALQLVRTAPSATTAVLTCSQSGGVGSTELRHIKVTAIRVNSVSDTPF